MATAPHAQNQGVGGALIAHLVDRAERAGVPIYLEATHAGRQVYARRGFVIVDWAIFAPVDDQGRYDLSRACYEAVMVRYPKMINKIRSETIALEPVKTEDSRECARIAWMAHQNDPVFQLRFPPHLRRYSTTERTRRLQRDIERYEIRPDHRAMKAVSETGQILGYTVWVPPETNLPSVDDILDGFAQDGMMNSLDDVNEELDQDFRKMIVQQTCERRERLIKDDRCW